MAGIVQHRRARDCMNNDPRRAQVRVNIRVLLNGRLLASPIAGSFPTPTLSRENSHNDHDTIGVVDCLVGDGKSPS